MFWHEDGIPTERDQKEAEEGLSTSFRERNQQDKTDSAETCR